MKVSRLRTQAVEIPFVPPIGMGGTAFRSVACIVAFLETDQGLIGEGLVYTSDVKRLRLIDDMVRSFEPLVVGADIRLSGQLLTRAWADLRHAGHAGFPIVGFAAIDGALLDLRAKAVGASVARLLGAARTAVPVYNSTDLWVSASLDELQRAAAAHVAKGYRGVKLREDVERVRAVREAVGPAISVMADFNQRLTVPEAVRLGRALQEFNLAWLEEPVVAHDHRGEAAVAAALDTPIASGESAYTGREAFEMLERGAVDVLMIDLQRMGGPTEFLKAARLAESYDVPLTSHLFHEMSLPLLAACPNAIYLEYMPWFEPLYAERLTLDGNGHAVVPDGPGWGFTLDHAAIRRLAVR